MTTRKRVDPDHARLDRVVAEARRAREEREQGYRARALKLFPWICGRCAREFDHSNVAELTVHHKNHDHDCNPSDGSNWELLCVYCHDNEHQRQLDDRPLVGDRPSAGGTHTPFAGLADILKRGD
jgi:5-methylcytosine-specific restriction endonuclease McrA